MTTKNYLRHRLNKILNQSHLMVEDATETTVEDATETTAENATETTAENATETNNKNPASIADLFPDDDKMEEFKNILKFYSMAATMTSVENDTSKLKFKEAKTILGIKDDTDQSNTDQNNTNTDQNNTNTDQSNTDQNNTNTDQNNTNTDQNDTNTDHQGTINQNTTNTDQDDIRMNDGTLLQHIINNSNILLNEGSFSSAIGDVKNNIQSAFNVVFDGFNLMKTAFQAIGMPIIKGGAKALLSWFFRNSNKDKVNASMQKQKAVLKKFELELKKRHDEMIEMINDYVGADEMKLKILANGIKLKLKQMYKQDMQIFQRANIQYEAMSNTLNKIKKEDDFDSLSKKEQEELLKVFNVNNTQQNSNDIQQPEQPGQQEQSEQPGQQEQSEQPGQQEQSEQPEQQEQQEQPEKQEQ